MIAQPGAGRQPLPTWNDVRVDHQRVIRDVTVRLPMASNAPEACRWTVAALSRHTPATISVLLHVHDRLRCVAATGAWQVYATVPPSAGIVGRVFTTGTAAAVPDVTADPDYLPVRPDVTAELCVPVLDPAGQPIGVLDLQWTEPVDLEPWREAAQQLGVCLGRGSSRSVVRRPRAAARCCFGTPPRSPWRPPNRTYWLRRAGQPARSPRSPPRCC
ncbi:hypothetical protein GCM10027614_52020 [Micromonospora vulcania]